MRRNNGVSRSDRLNSELQKEIYEIISRKLKNPLITEMFSIMAVDCANDLSFAKVYVSSMEGIEAAKESVKGLKNAAGFIRRELGLRLEMRRIPELKFIADDSIEQSAQILGLINQANKGNNDEN